MLQHGCGSAVANAGHHKPLQGALTRSSAVLITRMLRMLLIWQQS
jgi:hypothetical protein